MIDGAYDILDEMGIYGIWCSITHTKYYDHKMSLYSMCINCILYYSCCYYDTEEHVRKVIKLLLLMKNHAVMQYHTACAWVSENKHQAFFIITGTHDDSIVNYSPPYFD